MCPSSDEDVQRELARIPERQALVGRFVSQSGSVAIVNQGDSQLQVKSATPALVPGDAVRLERRNGDLVMIGPVAARSTTGRVTATGTLTTVEYPNGSGITADLRRNSAYTPAVNDLVLIDWSSGGVIVGKIDANPAPKPVLPPAPAAAAAYDVTFTALDSASYQSGYGWRTNDVWSSASNQGCWFYGSKIRDTIPDNASIQSASIYLPLQEQLGAAPFGVHGYESRPAGAPTISSTSTLASKSGWVGFPTALIDYLKANPGGFGYDFGGKNIWRGTQKDGQSGAVRVIYTA